MALVVEARREQPHTLLTLYLLAIGLEREMRWVLGSASEHLTDFRKRVLVPSLKIYFAERSIDSPERFILERPSTEGAHQISI